MNRMYYLAIVICSIHYQLTASDTVTTKEETFEIDYRRLKKLLTFSKYQDLETHAREILNDGNSMMFDALAQRGPIENILRVLTLRAEAAAKARTDKLIYQSHTFDSNSTGYANPNSPGRDALMECTKK